MKVKERGAWTAYNEGKGGKKSSTDQFNKSFKGQERNPRASEFASMDIEEYHHYSERAEYKEPKKDNNSQSSSSSEQQKKQSQSSARSTSQATRNIVSRVAGTAVSAVVGAVVVVTTYDTVVENEKAKEKPIIETINWEWSDDNSEAGIEFYDAKGNLIKATMSTITVVQIDPSCNMEGSIIYTATVTEDGKEYTDTKEVKLPKIAHDFDDGHMETIDGKIYIVSECRRCHEEFSIEISYEEK